MFHIRGKEHTSNLALDFKHKAVKALVFMEDIEKRIG
jgi:hypothetical protein